jgi:hypothetical protein
MGFCVIVVQQIPACPRAFPPPTGHKLTKALTHL